MALQGQVKVERSHWQAQMECVICDVKRVMCNGLEYYSAFCVYSDDKQFINQKAKNNNKNHAYVRQSISRPMRIVAPIQKNPARKAKFTGKKRRKKMVNFALLAGFFCIGATIRIGREMLCLPYAGFSLIFRQPQKFWFSDHTIRSIKAYMSIPFSPAEKIIGGCLDETKSLIQHRLSTV